jgi:WD40 repeat protein
LTCAAVSPDGTLAVSGGNDGIVRVWNLTTRKRVSEDWSLLPQTAADLGLTPDKKTLVAIDTDGTVKVADVGTRDVRATVNAVSGGVVALVVSPTGDKFATLAADGTVKAWSLTGAELRSWKLPVPPAAAAFGPDGKTLVTGNKDGTAYVLELP